MTKAYFSNIRSRILENISESKEEILICVAWFTSKEILGKLIDKAETGCTIKVIINDHFENRRLNFSDFISKKGSIQILSSESGRFLHDKFAIFDKKKLMTGSYNWTNSAEYYNHEYVIITDDYQMIKQFDIRFRNHEKSVINFELRQLKDIPTINSESTEEDFEQLENDLLNELTEAIELSIKAGAKINRSIILDILYRYGAIGASKRLVKEGADRIQSGLQKMFDINRLDLTIENIILKEKYNRIFDEEVLTKAREKLKKLGYHN
ncbi:phospholipase D-like domain-containing protein [Chryseobacterium sp. 18068]|uniref:phospholipase D-like domain-containing protein n=1 Tax=Chryseobacterium sp. 18068 TaxID=2681414 RepID=UPI001359C7BE|nr:phospholipase D-like domain-containing protein [Chryseobacterium sp. 18068]